MSNPLIVNGYLKINGAVYWGKKSQLEIDALTPGNGDQVFNSDLNKVQVYESGAWAVLGGGGGGSTDPKLMTDEEATRLGYRKYISGTDFTVTSSYAPENPITNATLIPYQLKNGSWRVKGEMPIHPVTSFYSNIGTGPNENPFVTKVHPDGRVLVGGGFQLWNGNATQLLAALDSTGNFSMNPGYFTGDSIRAICVQPDGKIIIGGNFSESQFSLANNIARLNSDLTFDSDFYQNLTSSGNGSGLNGEVRTVSIDATGKIYVGGLFTELNGQTRNRLIRINADGFEDAAFYTALTGDGDGSGFNGDVLSIKIQPADQMVLVGGSFTNLNNTPRGKLVRLFNGGGLDAFFSNQIGIGFDGSVRALAVQLDGKILVGGNFSTFKGNPQQYALRLNVNGSLDSAFVPLLAGEVNDVLLYADQKILMSLSTGLICLLSDGSSDPNFIANTGLGFDGAVNSAALTQDESVIVVGLFEKYNGRYRNKITKLFSDGEEDAIPANFSYQISGLLFDTTTGGTYGALTCQGLHAQAFATQVLLTEQTSGTVNVMGQSVSVIPPMVDRTGWSLDAPLISKPTWAIPVTVAPVITSVDVPSTNVASIQVSVYYTSDIFAWSLYKWNPGTSTWDFVDENYYSGSSPKTLQITRPVSPAAADLYKITINNLVGSDEEEFTVDPYTTPIDAPTLNSAVVTNTDATTAQLSIAWSGTAQNYEIEEYTTDWIPYSSGPLSLSPHIVFGLERPAEGSGPPEGRMIRVRVLNSGVPSAWSSDGSIGLLYVEQQTGGGGGGGGSAPAYFTSANSLLWFKPDNLPESGTQYLVDNSSGNNTPVNSPSTGQSFVSSVQLNGYSGIYGTLSPGAPDNMNSLPRYVINGSGDFHTYVLVCTHAADLPSKIECAANGTEQGNWSARRPNILMERQNNYIVAAVNLPSYSFGELYYGDMEKIDSIPMNQRSSFIVVVEFSQTGARFWRNGELLGNTGTDAGISMNEPSIALEKVILHEVVVMKTKLSDSDRQAAETYLATKYALSGRLPPGHPGAPPDTTPPPAPVISTIAGQTGNTVVINSINPVIVGTAEPLSTVKVYNVESLLGQTSADGSGNWTYNSSLSDSGTFNIAATATDAADNVSSFSTNKFLTIDLIAPDSPTISTINGEPVTGSVMSVLTNNPVIVGTAEPGSTVNVYNGELLLGTTSGDGPGGMNPGNWTFYSSLNYGGPYNINATATDLAGNVSSASSPVSLTISGGGGGGGGSVPTIYNLNVTGPAVAFSVTYAQTYAISGLDGSSPFNGSGNITTNPFQIFINQTNSLQSYTLTVYDSPFVGSGLTASQNFQIQAIEGGGGGGGGGLSGPVINSASEQDSLGSDAIILVYYQNTVDSYSVSGPNGYNVFYSWSGSSPLSFGIPRTGSSGNYSVTLSNAYGSSSSPFTVSGLSGGGGGGGGGGGASPPTVFSVTGNFENNNPMNLTVNYGGQADSWTLEYYDNTLATWQVVQTGIVFGSNSFNINATRPSELVSAQITVSYLGLSSTPFGVSIGGYTAPPAITSATVIDLQPTTVTIEWEWTGTATNYAVYQYVNQSGGVFFTEVDSGLSTSSPQSTTVPRPPASGGAARVFLRLWNGAITNNIIYDIEVPFLGDNSPILVSAAATNTDATTAQVEFSWIGDDGAQNYEIEQSSFGEWMPYESGPNGLSPNTVYGLPRQPAGSGPGQWRVRVLNVGQPSGWFQFTVDEQEIQVSPISITGVQVSGYTDTTADVTAFYSTDPTGLQVQNWTIYKFQGGSWNTVATDFSGSTSGTVYLPGIPRPAAGTGTLHKIVLAVTGNGAEYEFNIDEQTGGGGGGGGQTLVYSNVVPEDATLVSMSSPYGFSAQNQDPIEFIEQPFGLGLQEGQTANISEIKLYLKATTATGSFIVSISDAGYSGGGTFSYTSDPVALSTLTGTVQEVTIPISAAGIGALISLNLNIQISDPIEDGSLQISRLSLDNDYIQPSPGTLGGSFSAYRTQSGYAQGSSRLQFKVYGTITG